MKIAIFLSAVCLHLSASYGTDDTDGVGAFSYQDSTGKRYGGTYGLRDGQVVNQQGNFPPNFSPTFPDLDDFFPEYFNTLDNLLQEASPFIPLLPFIPPPPFSRMLNKPFFKRTFESNVDNQKLAYDAATNAFDLTANRAGYNQNFVPSRFFSGNFPGVGGFAERRQGFPGLNRFPGFEMPNYGRAENSAYASAALGPDYSHQVADISPANPNNPNINKFSSITNNPGGYKSVSSHSSVSSSDINGQKSSTRRAETIVDDNGVITKHVVQS